MRCLFVLTLKDFEVKGSPIIAYLPFLKEKYGEEGAEKVLLVMPNEYEEIMRHKLFASAWYTMDFFKALHDAINTVYAKGDMKYFDELGRYGAEYNASRFYKGFMKLAGPETMIRLIKMLWGFIYKKSYIEVKVESKYMEIEVHNFPLSWQSLCHTRGGYMQQSLTFAGAKNVQTKEVTCVRYGNKCCKHIFHWT